MRSSSKQLIIQIPVETTTVKDFCHRNSDNDYSVNKVCEQIFQFIKKEMPNMNVSAFCIKELIENAYDAYAMRGLEMGQHLEIKVVIKKLSNDSMVIRIKDNGPGFSDHRKGSYFDITEIIRENKNNDELLGGFGAGLSTISSIFQNSQGTLSLKNRKKEGATVSISYKKGL